MSRRDYVRRATLILIVWLITIIVSLAIVPRLPWELPTLLPWAVTILWTIIQVADASGIFGRKIPVEAEMLSESLLSDLCPKSLELYEQKLLLTPADSLVTRELMDQIEEGRQSMTHAIQFLIGQSGSGKSVLAYQALRNHLNAGGLGIWFPADLVSDSISIEDAFGKVLQAFHPRLVPEAGQTAVRLMREQFQLRKSQFLIVVDDLNRVDTPNKLLHKLSTWTKPRPSDSSKPEPLPSPFLIVCPVWPRVLESMNLYLDKTSWVHTVFVGAMTSTEAQTAIQASAEAIGRTITDAEAAVMAEKLGKDAILIGLYSELMANNEHVVPEDVIEKFVARSIKEAAIAHDGRHLDSEYREALSSLTLNMLQKRNLQPLWPEIRDWLQSVPDEVSALRDLISQEELCRMTRISGEKRLTFRHDRIRENLLVRSTVKLFEAPVTHSEVLVEPFYAEVIGQALLRSRQDRKFLRRMREKLPLALVVAVQCFGEPTCSYHEEIIEEVKEWAKSTVKTRSVPDSVLNAVCWKLLETDSPVVLEITEAFPRYWSILLARLRNGSARSGVLYCAKGTSQFRINDPLRDRIIEHAKERHGKRLLQQLRQFLTNANATDEELRGALGMAGLLGVSDLQDEIAVGWELATDKPLVLLDAIWAAIRCCKDEPERLLDPMMAYWASLLDEEGASKIHIAQDLRFGLKGVSNDIISYLIAQSRVHESLRWPITYLCGFIDSPIALEFAVKFWRGVPSLHFEWSDSSASRKLSQNSLSHLKTLWEDLSNEESVRRRAFQIWLTGVGWEEIDILKDIPLESPLSPYAIRKRAELGDESVVPDLCSILHAEDDSFAILLFNVAHNVWCDEIRDVAEYYLESFENNIPKDYSGGQLDIHRHLSRLLMMIPQDDAEMLLDKYWAHLGYSRLFIQTALYVGTRRCLELASSSINECPSDIPVFKHLSMHFGYREIGRMERFTAQHVQRLEPYLDRLDESTLRDLAEACQKFGIVEWSRRHLANRLSERWRKRYHPTDDDLLEELDKMATDRHYEWRVRHWLEGFDRRRDPEERALGVIQRWFASNLSIRGLQVAAASIEAIGTRNDLSILDEHEITGSEKEISKIKRSAQFAVYRRSLN